MLLELFKQIGLIENGVFDMSLDNNELINSIPSDEGKFSFIVGVLAGRLRAKQYVLNGSGNSSFNRKITDMRFNEDNIKNLYDYILNKYYQYDYGYAYSDLKEDCAELLIKTSGDWKISNNEISHYFYAGLTLHERFKKDYTSIKRMWE
jgi:CRISPR-associated protein Cas8b/Csh1 subtype I-B